MKFLQVSFLFCLSFFWFSAYGQTTAPCNPERFEDPLLEKLIGQWKGRGVIGVDSVRYVVNASWELQHQFILLTLLDAAQPPQYLANVYIGRDCVSERYVVHWLDNFGGRFSETLGYGTAIGQEIPFRFEYSDGPFINRFIFDSKDNTWRLFSTTKNGKGEWVTFGDIYLSRT